MKWTKKEIEYLKENYQKKIPWSIIVETLKRSKKSIRHKAARLELSRPRIPHNKPKNKKHRNIIDKKYYEKHKEKLYKQKRERIKKRKIELVKLMGGECLICGYNKCMWAFDFHHKSKEKDNHLSRIIMNDSKEKALKEVKKCILLCANCHRELHYNNKKDA